MAAPDLPLAGQAGPAMEAGIFLVDKPVGPTSFRVVQQVRRALGIKKVGHTGTLDPFASGLLVVCAGRAATRIISRLMAGDKEYEAVLRLGVETDTLDTEGRVVAELPVPALDRQGVESCLTRFVGTHLQTPPAFSALKHKGKPLYYYARRGREIIIEPRPVVIRELACVGIGRDTLTIRVVCGKGTYIRVLAADIGVALGTRACLLGLRRLRNGPFGVREAVDGQALADPREGRKLLLEHGLDVATVLGMLQNGSN